MPAGHVCVPADPAAHSQPGGAHPAVRGHCVQNGPTGGSLHRAVQRPETRGLQNPLGAMGPG